VPATAKGSEPEGPQPSEPSRVKDRTVTDSLRAYFACSCALSRRTLRRCACFPGGFRTRRFCALVSSWPRAKEGGLEE